MKINTVIIPIIIKYSTFVSLREHNVQSYEPNQGFKMVEDAELEDSQQ